jgi:hypothetical protein
VLLHYLASTFRDDDDDDDDDVACQIKYGRVIVTGDS